ncbi:hypothetical protein RhiirA4_471891 [Rhizophagus irregularis]|uniref:Uncharacterized protein n=1 Tax=Rhizophagus irregularis TaxID=588596 RepID=A0A2I1H3W6_9GLOM|nr:hypothetical protein RhiirA4_471891 [Rhizophagus irregularis]
MDELLALFSSNIPILHQLLYIKFLKSDIEEDLAVPFRCLLKNGKTKFCKFDCSGGLLKYRNSKDLFRWTFDEWKTKIHKAYPPPLGFGWASDLQKKWNQDSLLKKRKLRNQDSIWWASVFRRMEKKDQDSFRFGWASEEQKTKIRFRLAFDLWKSETKIRSGGLPKNNQRFIYTNT